MKEKIHLEAARAHFEIADVHNAIYEKEKDLDKKIALRTVAAQNYFYGTVNAIETVFAKKGIHSFNHENRMRNLLTMPELFDEGVVELYDLVDRDQRNKVAYRGENNEKYENIKKLSDAVKKLL